MSWLAVAGLAFALGGFVVLVSLFGVLYSIEKEHGEIVDAIEDKQVQILDLRDEIATLREDVSVYFGDAASQAQLQSLDRDFRSHVHSCR